MDIMVAPAADAIDGVAQDESWIEAGMSETAYEKLSKYSTLQENEKIMFSYITLSRGRRTNTDENEEDIRTPSELCPDADKHWDSLTQSCVGCEGIKSEWNDVLKTCICPTGTYGEFCEPCHTPREWRDNSCQCPNTYPLWDEISGNCLECPDSIPIWNTTTESCVQCLTDTDCKDATKPLCNTIGYQCSKCPTEKPLWQNGKCNACDPMKIWDGDACICNPELYETDSNDYCVCRTEEQIELELASNTPNAPTSPCYIKVATLGKLKGTFYFKWISGVHYYVCGTVTNFITNIHEGETNLGKIIDVGRVGTKESLEAEFKAAKPKYFTFDGSQEITLWFSDNNCTDNCGSIKFELRRIIDYCAPDK